MKKITMILAGVFTLLATTTQSHAFNQEGSAIASGHTLYCVGTRVTCFTDLHSGGSFVSGGYYYIFLETGIVYAQIYATERSSDPGDTKEFEFIPRGLEEGASFYSESDKTEGLALNELSTKETRN